MPPINLVDSDSEVDDFTGSSNVVIRKRSIKKKVSENVGVSSHKKKRIQTDIMPGNEIRIPLSDLQIPDVQQSFSQFSSSGSSQSSSAFSELSQISLNSTVDQSPFVALDGSTINPADCVGKVIECRLRNLRGSISSDFVKIFFSKNQKPKTMAEVAEVIQHDVNEVTVYYKTQRYNASLHCHGSYVGHVIHRKSSAVPPEGRDPWGKGIWQRILCNYCSLEKITTDKVGIIEIRYGGYDKFRRHVKMCHPDVKFDIPYEKLAKKLMSENYDQFLKYLLDFVVFNNLPFRVIGTPEFSDLCQLLNPAIHLPSVDQMLTCLKNTVQVYLTGEPSPGVSLCKPNMTKNVQVFGGTLIADAWESPSGPHVLTTSFEYVDSNFQRRQRVLGVKEIKGAATAQNIAGIIKRDLIIHDLHDKFHFAVSDSGKNMINSFGSLVQSRWVPEVTFEEEDQVEDEFPADPFMATQATAIPEEALSGICDEHCQNLPGFHMQFRCNAHLGNLIIGDIHGDTRCVDGKVWFTYLTDILTHIRGRLQLQQMLRDLVGSGAKKYLTVRWNSAHDALKIFTTIKGFGAVQEVLKFSHSTTPAKDRYKLPRLLQDKDFIFVQELYRLLNCMARPIDIFQADATTGPDILTHWAMAYQAITTLDFKLQETEAMRKTLLEYFKDRITPLFRCKTLILATLVHPTKKHLFRWIDRFMPTNPLKAPKSHEARALLESLVNAENTQQEGQEMTAEDFATSINFNDCAGKTHNLDVYMSDNSGSALTFSEYWRYNRSQYPVIAKYARMFHGLSASSATVERSFSSLGLMKTNRRFNLSVSRLESLVLYKQALANEDACIEDKVPQESNFDAYHSCSYGSLLKTGTYVWRPLLVFSAK